MWEPQRQHLHFQWCPQDSKQGDQYCLGYRSNGTERKLSEKYLMDLWNSCFCGTWHKSNDEFNCKQTKKVQNWDDDEHVYNSQYSNIDGCLFVRWNIYYSLVEAWWECLEPFLSGLWRHRVRWRRGWSISGSDKFWKVVFGNDEFRKHIFACKSWNGKICLR